MDIRNLHQLFLKSSGICTDTRKISGNCMFFALKGEHFNGNDYAGLALEKGAATAVVDEGEFSDRKMIRVTDALQTLQDLAAFHRQYLGLPILALTGSNGKTTTKELLTRVLSRKFQISATIGNLNNHIGVPLTILSMTKNTEIGIVEMGANHRKEIEFLCGIAQPDFGYITNFGKAHLEGFGGVEGVVMGKKELYEHLRGRDRLLFLNSDDPLQAQEKSYARHYSFGEKQPADLKMEYFVEDSYAGLVFLDVRVTSKLIGSYNCTNIGAACCIGYYFEISPEDIADAVSTYDPRDNRSQVIRKGSNMIILDAYNANPTSMAAALENLSSMEKKPKVVFLGDMFELGASACSEHQALVDQLQGLGLEQIYLLGEHFFATESGDSVKKFRSFEDFRREFNPADVRDAQVLIKGSRGMAMERILDML